MLEVLQREAGAEGHAGRARRLQRHHQGRGARGDAPIRARSTRRWSTPISPAARSTISSASRSRRCCGASCPGARSAGRVQSVALRLVCDRELEIETFAPREYWSLVATLATPDGGVFEARLVGADGKKLDAARHRQRRGGARPSSRDSELATFTRRHGRGEAGEAPPLRRRSPPRPCSRRPRASSASRRRRPCSVAQRLYEGVDIGGETVGLITYMRTDGVDMAPEAIAAARRVIGKEYGERYVPGVAAPLHDQGQERPGSARGDPPDRHGPPARRTSRKYLEPEQARLYELIWKRTIASQMESAELERTTVDIAAQRRPAQARPARHRPGRQLRRLPRRSTARAATTTPRTTRTSGRLPPMSAGERARARGASTPTQHFTEPPPRYSEATLVKRMEELGIGRPSTYASILDRAARPRICAHGEEAPRRPRTRAASSPPSSRASSAATSNTTSPPTSKSSSTAISDRRDRLEGGAARLLARLLRRRRRDQGAAHHRGARRAQRAARPAHLPADKGDGSDPRACPTCGNGQLSLKLGKFGAFIGCSNYPECRYTRQLAGVGRAATARARRRRARRAAAARRGSGDRPCR